MSNLCLVIVSSCSFGYVYFKTGPKLLFRVFFLVIVGVQGVFLPKDVMVCHRWWWQVNSHPGLSRPLQPALLYRRPWIISPPNASMTLRRCIGCWRRRGEGVKGCVDGAGGLVHGKVGAIWLLCFFFKMKGGMKISNKNYSFSSFQKIFWLLWWYEVGPYQI